MSQLTREGYLARMRRSIQFKRFGITPQWRPGEGDVEGFCHDEVVRQFHDTRVRSDGGVRVDWMMAAWEYARRAAESHLPTATDILHLGALVEPHQNSTIGFRTMEVLVGGAYGAPPPLLRSLVTHLAARVALVESRQGRRGPHAEAYRELWQPSIYSDPSKLTDADIESQFVQLVAGAETADDWYLAYEAIHPFADGNGRTGKILHNWLLGTLDEPVLVADYFGGGNP